MPAVPPGRHNTFQDAPRGVLIHGIWFFCSERAEFHNFEQWSMDDAKRGGSPHPDDKWGFFTGLPADILVRWRMAQ